jgi:hypothetical protein
MALDTLLASLKCGVSEVAGVQASRAKAITCNPVKLSGVAEVSGGSVDATTATPATSPDTKEVSVELPPTGACTRETPETLETIKDEVSAPRVGAGDTAIASRWWLLHYADRDPVDVACCSEVPHAEILERNPDAIAAEPLGPIDPDAWEERAAIAEFDGGLSRDAAERLAWREDDRRTCTQCANLVGRRCLAAKRGEIVASRSYEPIRDILKRCEGYTPGTDDPDRRHGRERWPGLIHKGDK